MTQYNGLAAIYDQLMQGIDYGDWAAYIVQLVDCHGGVPEKTALDVACGTGNTTLALAGEGYSVIGLDLSAEMLELAGAKTEDAQVSYVQADMRQFSLPSPVGLVVSFQDGINYLLSQDDFRQAAASVYRALLPGGLFIFDINRVEKLKGIKEDLAWVDCNDFTLIWETRFVAQDIWEICVTGFSAAGNGLYHKFSEVHKERIIPEHEVVDVLRQAGFTLAGSYAAFTMQPPEGHNTRRVFYVAQKEG